MTPDDLTFSELLDRGIGCVAAIWCAGEMSTEHFVEWLTVWEKTDRAQHQRAMDQIADQVNNEMGEAA